MAKLPRNAATHLTLAAALLAAAAASGAAQEVELVGTWHVLVHYTDDNTAHPDAMRWEDRVWVFEPAGSRLRWTDYPIVVFRDKSGRFEALGTNRASRVLHAWEPNASQREQIESGLEVNPRGKKSKTLRGSDTSGWYTKSRATPASASVITYTENWSITGLPDRPVFERVDVLGSARTETLDGVTRFTTTEVEPGGRVLLGSFERDGTRHGTFRMTLAGPVSGVTGSGKTQGERLREAWFGEWAGALGSEDALREEVERRLREGEQVPEEARAEVRQEIRRSIERAMRRKGIDTDDHQREIELLTKKVEKAVFEDGRTLDEVGRMLEAGEIQP